MKIESVRYYPLVQRQEDPTWSFALATYPVIDGWIVEIRAGGEYGHGYAQAVPHIGYSFHGIKAALDYLHPRLTGRDPFECESILRDLDAYLVGNAPAKAGIDGALYDLCAKLLDSPIHRLFGGAVRRTIPQLRIVQIKPPKEMAALAKGLVDKGYKYLKIKLKGDIDLDVDRIAAIRDAIGDGPRLTLDPNQSYTPKAAIQALSRMERYRIDLVEQPVPAQDNAGLALVTRNVDIAVEADESAASVESIFSLVANRVVDAVSLKTAKLGGLRNTMLAARICDVGRVRYRFGATFGPRLYCAQALHVAAAFPNLDYACELAEFDHLLDDPYEGLEVVDGSLTVPEGKGTGVSIRKDTTVFE